MANEEQVAILRQGAEVWNKWRLEHLDVPIDLSKSDFRGIFLIEANLRAADLSEADFAEAHLSQANLREADLSVAHLAKSQLLGTNFRGAKLRGANLVESNLTAANLGRTDLGEANLLGANLEHTILLDANLISADLSESQFAGAELGRTIFGKSDLSRTRGLEDVFHSGPSNISIEILALSKGNIPRGFLRGCGLSDADIEYAKLYNPALSNDEKIKILYKIYDLQASQAIQISPLFISYSHSDTTFVDKIESHLNRKGIRFWRDVHDMKAGRIEKQVNRAIRQNPTVLLILSSSSLKSDWVEHEVRTARTLEKEIGRDVLCPVALDDSWKDSRWPKRIMEQIMEYNILDFSVWKDDTKFSEMFRKLVDGLELFYKG
jgi:uncharacterized protein YjbI with pentapeptide repeats